MSRKCLVVLACIGCTGTVIGVATLVISSIVLVFALESRASGGCAALADVQLEGAVAVTIRRILEDPEAFGLQLGGR